MAALKRSRWLYVLVSLLLLAPCYWQSRVQAGDLSSHIYNAWLAQSIERGEMCIRDRKGTPPNTRS